MTSSAEKPPLRPSAPAGEISPEAPFWRTTPLAAMNAEQWESLCDGCGRCCLVKMEDEETGVVVYTDVACQLFDTGTCRCSDYEHRSEKVEDCVRLTPDEVASLDWLPPTCAYRLLDEGKDLPFWHPLVSGDPDSVRAAGISVAGRVAGLEDDYGVYELMDRIVSWPVRWPKGAKGEKASAPGRAAKAGGKRRRALSEKAESGTKS